MAVVAATRTAEPRSTAVTPAAEITGPPGPGLLQTGLAVLQPIQTRLAARRRYGPVFRTGDAIAGDLVHIADREMIEEIFRWKPEQYKVAEPREVMEPVTGPSSILLLDGDRHMRMRKLMLPPFHGKAIAHYAQLIEEITEREVERWHPGERIRTRGVAQRITLEVIIRAVFGIEDPERIAELRRVLPRLSSPSPFLLLVQKDLGPLSPWGRFVRLRDRVDELLYREIRERRGDPGREEPLRGDPSGPTPRADILTLLLSARDEEGEPLSDRELRDQLITLLLAGHETTATSIGWAFERLLRAPAALERLTAEVKAGEGGEYLEAVINETFRVRPVVPEVFRAPTETTELGGYVFDVGQQLAVSIMLVQYDPELYPPDPEAFRPERFLDGAPEPYTLVPFGGGVRRCLGAAFAQLEIRTVLQTVAARATLRATDTAPERIRLRHVTLVPEHGARVTMQRRAVDAPGAPAVTYA